MKISNFPFLKALIPLIIFLIFSCNGSDGGNHNSQGGKGYNPGGGSNTGNGFRENSIRGPQYIDIDKYELKVTGLVQTPAIYTYVAVIDSFPKITKGLRLKCVEGWSVFADWEGVAVRDIVRKSNPKLNANTIIFRAEDGYSTSFPLEYIMNNEIIIAYNLNGKTLPPERGFPFELVAEDKWGYKWIKWVKEIEISADSTYKGYWESRGYSNVGDLNKSFVD